MDNFFMILNKGGVMMYPLYLCSLIAVGIILAKWTELMLSEQKTAKFASSSRKLLNKGEVSKLRDMGHEKGSPLERVLYFTRGKGKNLERLFEIEANQEIEGLGSHLPVLTVIARISPLLGLLGTVVGMIKVFYRIQISGGSVDAGSLGGGIWMALLTTAYGLSIAIPAIIFHHYFVRKIERINLMTKDLLERVLIEEASHEE